VDRVPSMMGELRPPATQVVAASIQHPAAALFRTRSTRSQNHDGFFSTPALVAQTAGLHR